MTPWLLLLGAILVSIAAARCWRQTVQRRVVRIGVRLIAVPLACAALLALGTSGFLLWVRFRSQPASAERQLFPGVVYTREVLATPRPLVVHLVRIDLHQRGLSFLVTPPEPIAGRKLRASTTRSFLRRHGLQLAMNGDFFHPFHSNGPLDFYPHEGDAVDVSGLAASRGVIYSRSPSCRLHTLFLSGDNQASIGAACHPPAGIFNAVSGDRLLVKDGRVSTGLGAAAAQLEPRTAVALDQSGRYLLLLLVDGRQSGYSEGVSLRELGELARRHGARTALNLDGGGSTTLATSVRDGEVVLLNSPIHTRIPYRERPVANHLGLWMSGAPAP